jgi:NitT/TauT family transport system permease protein
MSRLTPLLGLASFLLLWSGYVHLSGVSRFVLVSPEAALRATFWLLTEQNTWRHIGHTALSCILGYGLAVGFGLAFGGLMGLRRQCDRALGPLVIALQAVPKIALVPLFTLWFGFGIMPRIAIAASIAMFPVLIAARAGLRDADPRLIEAMACMGASRGAVLRWVLIPSALSQILTGMEIGVVLAFAGTTVAEFLAGRAGLGHMVILHMQEMQIARLFGVIIIQSVLALGLYCLVRSLRWVLTPWARGRQG